MRNLLATLLFLAASSASAYTANGGDYVNLRDYLPANQPDGVTDNSAGFQLVATTLCARPSFGGRIFIPQPPSAAQYKAHDINNVCGNWWEGAGAGGVGSSNQTATASIVRGGASIDYSDAVAGGSPCGACFMQWRVAGFPAFRSSAHINGGGISRVSLFDGVSIGTALVSEGTQDWAIDHVVINGAYNGVFMKGDEFPVTSHISMYGTRNKNYEIVGDISGQKADGTACSTASGDCSTRNDVWYGEYLTNIDNGQTNTVFTITGFVATTTLSHTSGEGPAYGMVVTCPAGLNANLAQCPAFGRFSDNQFESFKFDGVQISDFINFTFDHLYAVGDASVNNNNSLSAGTVNYSASTSPAGTLTVSQSELFATGGDCAYLYGTMYDVSFIDDNHIYACNLSNTSFNGIDSSGSLGNLKVQGNTIGTVGNYGGPNPLGRAVAISNGTFNAEVTGNIWGNINPAVAPVGSTSTQPWTVHIADNIGPGGAPTVGSCGTSPSISGIDHALLATAGSGSPTSCVVTFGSIWTTPPVCSVTPALGGGQVTGVSTSNTTVTWAGSGLTGAYSVQCSQP